MNKKEEILKLLGFREVSTNIYEKVYPSHNNYKITVDLKKGKISYRDDNETVEGEKVKPDGKILIGEHTSTNLNIPENLVVLEAVDRLLEKGYSPSHLHLEKKWTLGRTAKGGRADIIVYDRETDEEGYLKPLIIIECKTWGKEFEKEKQRLKKNGGQLFSYLQQEKGAKYLILYTSDIFENDEGYFVDYDNVIIKVIDDEKKLKECKESQKKRKQKKPCSFQEANNKEELFEIWKRLYRNYWYKYGIFEPDVLPYDIELKPLKKKDLVELKNPQGLFNKFAEILRHSNISDNANAFNKMLNLILCKIVDEEEKTEDDELDFQVKGDEEFERLVDRLQRLYYVGMKNHLGIYDFVYFPDEEIKKRIELYPERKDLEEVFDMFKQIKYYTNNEFAFKEVHNKRLFDENVEILIEVMELIQNYKFKYAHNHQILGDFFELLLDFGVKQSEGQFFTPLPIVSFINGSINIKRIVEEKLRWEIYRDRPFPKFLDFACGAGHFLTDMMDKIRELIPQFKELQDEIKKDNVWEKKTIYGIEKDYRLARTAKIACFLAGDGEANVIYGDGLKNHKELKTEVEKFDVISTNPPYSVRKFKKYLDIPDSEYELLPFLSEDAKEIEVLFIERAKQLLKEDIGRVGIILPSSILSNSGIYEKAREILLKYFEIKAIVELGSNAFIATGTNTIILFLKRRKDGFSIDRRRLTEEIFSGRYFVDPIFKKDYLDGHRFLDIFIKYRNLPKLEYIDFVRCNKPSGKLFETQIFKDYKTEFEKSNLIKNLKKKKEFKNLSDDEKQRKLEELFIEFAKEKEKEKFFYFLLTFLDGYKAYDERFYTFNKVLIVKAFNEKEKQKQFLGYEFSKRRGYEGIKIFKDENGKLTTKLYDPENYDNPKKVSFYVRASFDDKYMKSDECLNIDEELKENVKWCNLVDLIDFEKVNIDKAINLDCKRQELISSKWEMVRLGEVADVEKGENITKKEVLKGNIPVVAGGKEPAYYHNRANREGDIITVSASGANAGYVNYWETPIFASDCSTIKAHFSKAITKYLYYILKINQNLVYSLQRGQAQPHVYPSDLKSLKIPLPPIEVQKQIVEEVEKLEKKGKENLEKIEKLKRKIKENIEIFISKQWRRVRLGDITKIESGGTPRTNIKEYWNGNIYWATLEDLTGKYVYKTKRTITEEGLKKSNAKLLPVDTVLFSSRATIGKVAIAKVELATNQGFKNFICDKNKILPEFLYYMLKKEAKNIENLGSGATYKEVSKKQLENYEIPLPSIEEQQKLVKEIEDIESQINHLKEKNQTIKAQIEKIIKESI